MQKGSRFAYALDYIYDQNKNLDSEKYIDCQYDIKMRNILTPAGNSVAITGPSSIYHNESSYIINPEGLTCFGKPTLETLQI